LDQVFLNIVGQHNVEEEGAEKEHERESKAKAKRGFGGIVRRFKKT
jgi:hypothetical protein